MILQTKVIFPAGEQEADAIISDKSTLFHIFSLETQRQDEILPMIVSRGMVFSRVDVISDVLRKETQI